MDEFGEGEDAASLDEEGKERVGAKPRVRAPPRRLMRRPGGPTMDEINDAIDIFGDDFGQVCMSVSV